MWLICISHKKDTPFLIYLSRELTHNILHYPVKNANKETGVINAGINNAAVTVDITRADGKTRIKVSARKYFLPKPEIARGIIYRIKEELK